TGHRNRLAEPELEKIGIAPRGAGVLHVFRPTAGARPPATSWSTPPSRPDRRAARLDEREPGEASQTRRPRRGCIRAQDLATVQRRAGSTPDLRRVVRRRRAP